MPRMNSGPRAVALIPIPAVEQPRNRDNGFAFRADSYFYYLTGFTEPQALLVLTSEATQHAVLRAQRPGARNLGRLPPGPWPRRRPGGGRVAHSFAELDTLLPRLLENRQQVWYPLPPTPAWLRAWKAGWPRCARGVRKAFGARAAGDPVPCSMKCVW